MTRQETAAASRPVKRCSLAQAVAAIPPGATIALGGHGLMHRPMAALREIARQRLRGLRLVGWDGGLDADFLAGAGCLATAEIPPPALDRHGPARNFERAVLTGNVGAKSLPQDVALARFWAAALGLPSLPLRGGLAGETVPGGKAFSDPFTGEALIAVAAIMPDVAIIHGRVADAEGNVRLHADDARDASRDLMIARAAGTVIVTVEQFVSREAVRIGAGVLLGASEVAMVAEVPFGAHPCGFADRYATDGEALDAYHAASATAEGFAVWLAALPNGADGRPGYLDSIGSRRLMAISRNRACLD